MEGNGTKEPKLNTLVGNFEIILVLSKERQIKMSGYIGSDDTPKEINQRIDLFQDTIDRQFIRTDIVNKQAQIAAHLQGIKQVRDQYDSLVAKQSSGEKLSSMDKQKVANCKQTVERGLAEVESLQAAITVGKEKLAST